MTLDDAAPEPQQADPSPAVTTKACPYCAEEIGAAAIKCHLCGERLKPSSVWSSITRWLIDDGKAAFTLLALAIYAIVRIALDSFYGALAVTPEEVGLTQTLIVAHAVLYFVFFLLSLVAIEGFAAGITMAFIGWGSHRAERNQASQPGPAIQLFSLIPIFLGLLPGILWLATPHLFKFLASSTLGVATSVLALLLLAVGAVLLVSRLSPAPSSAAPTIREPTLLRWAGKTLFVALVAAVVVMSLALADRAGSNLASHVKDGSAVRTSPFNILVINADPVCLNWASADHAYVPPRPFIYLGQSNSTLILYDFSKSYERPLRVPSSGVTLSIADPPANGASWTCPSTMEGVSSGPGS